MKATTGQPFYPRELPIVTLGQLSTEREAKQQKCRGLKDKDRRFEHKDTRPFDFERGI
jgi:hypothetical protein